MKRTTTLVDFDALGAVEKRLADPVALELMAEVEANVERRALALKWLERTAARRTARIARSR